MTKKEYEEKMTSIDLKIRDLEIEKKKIKREYADSFGGPYKHLVGKWVTATYRSYGKDTFTITGFWKGVSISAGSLVEVEVYKAKKDGTQSSRTNYAFISDLVSVVETEQEK